ncbi:adenylyl-sulfate kinase [Streptomyces sp. ISL-86]|uniref:adenylyl-sulfate kinase n=1 Tax=Streptomyces sp. ISL-86 TaxID=2819187 RepID=UPI0020362F24|nr:adenylyl-sulfate kinase [Streptomyces sp. ISL-86]
MQTRPPLTHRPSAPTERGATVWLTGLPSAGKTTLALVLAERLRAEGHEVAESAAELLAFLTERGLA